jgi:hypothetical protein
MPKNTITLTEAQFNKMVEDCVRDIINEGMMDEAFGDGLKNFGRSMKSAVQGAKQGYQGQQMLNRGTDNFKQEWGREELAQIANPWSARPENTASMQASEAYKMYKYHKSESDKYLALYNKLTNQYRLNKDGVGQRSSNQKGNVYGTGGGIIANKRARGSKFGGSVMGRDRMADTRGKGLWG